jgi:hypothetical protein
MKNLLPIRPNNAEVLFLNVAHRGNLTGEIIAKKAEAVEREYLQPLQILADISSPFASEVLLNREGLRISRASSAQEHTVN